ncbi:MAG: hypothetical protein PVI30_23390, partial [Myxococcales bacterium]
MDPKTLELLKALQSGAFDADTLDIVEDLLESQRRELMEVEDLATLADISELLEVWAESAPTGLAARAVALAADVAERELDQPERAAQLLTLALELSPGHPERLERLEALLRTRGELDRLEAVLGMQADAARGLSGGEPVAARIYRSLGRLRVETTGNVDRAVEAYEAALELDADLDTLRELADLYADRGDEGDAEQAAELYTTLADVVGNPEGRQWAERALDLSPARGEALALLEQWLPVDDHDLLEDRWTAYLEHSDDEVGRDARRGMLARMLAAQERYRDALICIAPLADKGDPVAAQLKEAFLENLEGAVEDGQGERATAPPEQAPSRALPVRSGETIVGFRLPDRVSETLEGMDLPEDRAAAVSKAVSDALGKSPAAAAGSASEPAAAPAPEPEPEPAPEPAATVAAS